MPLFSIIVVHYQGTIPRETYLRGINSILSQTLRDYEVLVYHDGPLIDPAAPTPVPFRPTIQRYNDWGHSLRDLGIREATGEYILHFNADNLLYPHALQTLASTMREPSRLTDLSGVVRDKADIIIYPVVMHDHVRYMDTIVRLNAGSGAKLIMTGNPPWVNWVDCMQFVMRRSLWLAEGGWADKRKTSDGEMYARFAEKYGYRGVGQVLGEHF